VAVTDAVLVLLAAGRGERAGGSTPKQFAVDSRGRSLLARGLAAAAAGVEWRQVIVVAPADAVDVTTAYLAAADLPGTQVVAGGAGRLDSLQAGIAAVDPGVAVAVVHDGTRPFTPSALIRDVVRAVCSGGSDAAWPSARPANTVLSLEGESPHALPPADLLVVATPIAVQLPLLTRVLADQRTSEGAVVPLLVSAGARWTTVPDSPLNFKVTTSHDLHDALELMDALPWPRRDS
jgi:2-C-methyl-D-erythritol 4-phosphate cytidylyltransferase